MVGVHGLGLGLVWCLYRPMVRVLAVSLGLLSDNTELTLANPNSLWLTQMKLL